MADERSAGNASMKNSKAPAIKTHYDILSSKNSQDEYYKLMIQEKRMEKARGSLSQDEKNALELASDLDILTCKILVKLKVLPDFHPELNTMRALTGMESREDIAKSLAEKHYNKAIVDRFVGKYVSVKGVDDVLTSQQNDVRGVIGRNLGLGGGGFNEAWTGSATFQPGSKVGGVSNILGGVSGGVLK